MHAPHREAETEGLLRHTEIKSYIKSKAVRTRLFEMGAPASTRNTFHEWNMHRKDQFRWTPRLLSAMFSVIVHLNDAEKINFSGVYIWGSTTRHTRFRSMTFADYWIYAKSPSGKPDRVGKYKWHLKSHAHSQRHTILLFLYFLNEKNKHLTTPMWNWNTSTCSSTWWLPPSDNKSPNQLQTCHAGACGNRDGKR